MQKPFENLRHNDLHQEFTSRRVRDTTDLKKPELQQKLKSILQGVQHVPTLLLTSPEQSFSALNLLDYTVLDCEPPHDLKGHLGNILKELPYILEGNNRSTCEAILHANSSDKITGAYYRISLFQSLLFLKKQQVDQEIVTLLET